MSRSEEDILTQSPVVVTFGGQEYEIKPLPIKYSLPWVKKVAKILTEVVAETNMDESADLGEIIGTRPEELINLLFEYARNLNREEIEEKASSAEIVRAFEGVMAFERPLFSMALRAFMAATPGEDLAKLLNISLPNGAKTLSK